MNISKKLQDLCNKGFCPNLLNDDNGHWALVFDGFQSVPAGDEPEDISTSFHVEARFWKDTIEEAIEYGIKELE